MLSSDLDRDFGCSLAAMTATRGQWTLAFVVWAILLAAFLIAAPFAEVQLPRSNAIVTAVQLVLLITNLVTAYLLYGQFVIFGAHAILVLASGYLFAGLLTLPYSLAFPGLATPEGLIGGLQTTPWSYIFWHVGFAFAATVYALLKDRSRRSTPPEARTRTLAWTVAFVTALAGAASWICIEADRLLPMIFVDELRVTHMVRIYVGMTSLAAVVAVIVLWPRRRTVLDAWLLVALWAVICEPILAAVLNSSRFTVGFYSSRIFSMVTSSVVLAVLLSQMTSLHRKLADMVRLLERERRSKMMSMDAVTASIAHEARQPLAAIAANGGAALLLIDQPKPDLAEIRDALTAIVRDSLEADHVLDGVRALFRTPGNAPQEFDVNDAVRSALQMSQADLSRHGIALYTALSPDVPPVTGHKAQLREVVGNLVQNAVEAMSDSSERPRLLRLTTGTHHGHSVSITVDDSGPGISPDELETVFDAFFTTKARGTGLGLAICRIIVERHGGHIAAAASQFGGACFKIVLPCRHEPL